MFYDCPELPITEDDPSTVECCSCGKMIQYDEPAHLFGVEFECNDCYMTGLEEFEAKREVA